MRLKLLAMLCARLVLPGVLLTAPLRRESGPDALLPGLNYGLLPCGSARCDLPSGAIDAILFYVLT